MKTLITITLCLIAIGLSGCADKVGDEEFVCPMCGAQAGHIHSIGDWSCKMLVMHCSSCGGKSGEFESIREVTKQWKFIKGD